MNEKPDVDVQAYFEAIPHGNEQIRLSRYLMRELSLPADLFTLMDVRWDPKARAAAFPMRDADGLITGIRYRDVKSGQKWSLKGGHDGLFYIPEYFSSKDHEIFVCEGPTDMLAAAACGITNIVGRSSCTSGTELIREMVQLCRADVITIVADDDEPKTRPDGTTFRPGIDGARALAKNLNMTYRIMLPPPPKKAGKTCKDLRQWYSEFGMTKESFLAMATSAKWNVPKLGI